MKAEDLRGKRKAVESQHSKPSLVRLHRATSWLARAEAETEDQDAQFVFLWISFNAAYAQELGIDLSERERLLAFLGKLLEVDEERMIHAALFGQFSGPVRTLVDNRFVFEPFWRALRDHDSSDRWQTSFAQQRQSALRWILEGNTLRVLGVVFDRLYVLRNQIVHGGATWNSSVNRAQVRDGVRVMLTIVPILIELMIDHPQLDLGDINYPVV